MRTFRPQGLFRLGLAAMIVLAAPMDLASGADLFVPARTKRAAAEETAVIALVNAHRARLGLASVTENPALVRIARAHSEFMRRTQFLSHDGFRGSGFVDRARTVGYSGVPRAENVAYGYRDAEEVFAGWMTSTGHRRNIELDDVDEIGVGAVTDADTGEIWWTMVIGRAPGRRGHE